MAEVTKMPEGWVPTQEDIDRVGKMHEQMEEGHLDEVIKVTEGKKKLQSSTGPIKPEMKEEGLKMKEVVPGYQKTKRNPNRT